MRVRLPRREGAKCWGSGINGAIGDGSSATARPVAVDVSGLTSGVTHAATGFVHSCAATASGSALCWGDNSKGQPGDGGIVKKLLPVAVSGLATGVANVSAGFHHSSALTVSGVKCWGLNTNAQLVDGTTTQRLSPADVPTLLAPIATVKAAGFSTCVLTVAGAVKCWGANASGQLGDGTDVDRPAPVDVTGLPTGVVALAVGNSFACVLTNVGGVECWGDNTLGQLGDGSVLSRSVAGDVPSLSSGVSVISAGSAHACATLTSGVIKCWGTNYAGHLGDGIRIDRLSPADVVSLGGSAASVSAGITSTWALLTGGGLKC